MVEKVVMQARKVVDLAQYRTGRSAASKAFAARTCRHCGAALSDDESEDECSSAFNVEAALLRKMPRKSCAD